jgi:hypothetical protein
VQEKLKFGILIASKICKSEISQDLTGVVILLIKKGMGKIPKSD